MSSHHTSSHNTTSYHIAWSDADFPAVKKQEMLDIKASPTYMGNPQGEGAIWQRNPSGADVKVGGVKTASKYYTDFDDIYDFLC